MFNYFFFSLITLSIFDFSRGAARLGNYRIKNGITVSGISSGGAMANQLHVSHSSIITGSGTIAGPPYYCAQGSVLVSTTWCMSNLFTTGINMQSIISKVASYRSQGLIDDTANLKNHNVYLFSGSFDTVVSTNVVKKGQDFFNTFMDQSRIKEVYSSIAAHGMVTDSYGGVCSVVNIYFLNNCNFNLAHDILTTLHPDQNILKPSSGAYFTGNLIEFDQTEFFPAGSSSSISMDSTGYLYVPQQCETGECHLHIALHGCSQGKYAIGDVYIRNAGYNQVADLNNFIILYPQAKLSMTSNPMGCWDWWGYSDVNYANKEGKQIKAIKAMIDRITLNK